MARLARLVHKRQTYRLKQVPGQDPISADSAAGLFTQICGRTDEMYCVCEHYREGVHRVLAERLQGNQELRAGIVMPGDTPSASAVGELRHGPLKDACR